jgi:hypothetical protein
MKKLMITLFAIAAAASMAIAADKPDFSGTWKMDPDKSTFGPLPPPTSITSKIDHKDPDITVATTQVGPDQGSLDAGGAQVKFIAKYTLSEDGKTLTNALSISTPGGDFDLNIILVKQ